MSVSFRSMEIVVFRYRPVRKPGTSKKIFLRDVHRGMMTKSGRPGGKYGRDVSEHPRDEPVLPSFAFGLKKTEGITARCIRATIRP